MEYDIKNKIFRISGLGFHYSICLGDLDSEMFNKIVEAFCLFEIEMEGMCKEIQRLKEQLKQNQNNAIIDFLEEELRLRKND